MLFGIDFFIDFPRSFKGISPSQGDHNLSMAKGTADATSKYSRPILSSIYHRKLVIALREHHFRLMRRNVSTKHQGYTS